ncbi:MAG: helix-turn-helix domain-containing protein [Bifidobacteriaceae bacterium]|jgi:excisionase family DNA binding protein|nr:helix-turn-helix domain-containing protein [Bifidobacteriaceae bacterium]
MSIDTTPSFADLAVLRRYFDVAEASAYTGLSQKSVRDAIRYGEIPAKRIGRRLLIDRFAIDRLPNITTVPRPGRRRAA